MRANVIVSHPGEISQSDQILSKVVFSFGSNWHTTRIKSALLVLPVMLHVNLTTWYILYVMYHIT